MKKNNFLIFFETLTNKEIKSFENHLNANYYNSKIILQIFNFYLKLKLKKKETPPIKIACAKIFGIASPNPKDIIKLQNGLSDLYLILKDFLIQKEVVQTSFEKDLLWLNVLVERELHHYRNLHLKKIKKQIHKKQVKSIWTPLHQLQLVHFEFFKNDFKKNNSEIHLISDGIEALDDFYISFQLKYAAENLNREHLFSIPSTPSPFLNLILSVLQKDPSAFSLQNQLYYYVYLFLQNKNSKHFSQLKKFVMTHQVSLDREERLSALMYMINYLATELKKGNLKLLQETFELYKWGLDAEKIMVHNGCMDTLQFHNIINVACRLKEFSWCKNFIVTHQQYLEEHTSSQNISIGYAMIYFAEKQFQKVLDSFEEVKFIEVIFEIQARVYLLASQYELNKVDDLDIHCESFIRFVKRSKNLGESNKLAAINFARILQYLLKKNMSKKEIKENIQNENMLFFKTWLLEKLVGYKRL